MDRIDSPYQHYLTLQDIQEEEEFVEQNNKAHSDVIESERNAIEMILRGSNKTTPEVISIRFSRFYSTRQQQ